MKRDDVCIMRRSFFFIILIIIPYAENIVLNMGIHLLRHYHRHSLHLILPTHESQSVRHSLSLSLSLSLSFSPFESR